MEDASSHAVGTGFFTRTEHHLDSTFIKYYLMSETVRMWKKHTPFGQPAM
jgi:hypothetical protein